jgi:hypothetical protein
VLIVANHIILRQTNVSRRATRRMIINKLQMKYRNGNCCGSWMAERGLATCKGFVRKEKDEVSCCLSIKLES